MGSYCLIAVLLISCAAAAADAACRGTDTSFENNCYDWSTVRGNFDIASGMCQKYGMNLVKILNAPENYQIASDSGYEFDETIDRFWIGGSDQAATGDWRWTDGTQFNYSNWRAGEPLEDRHCAAMLISTGKWISVKCDTELNYLCEYLGGSGPSPSSTCPPCPPCSSTTLNN